MTKPALNPLFEGLHHINAGCEANNDDWRLSCLRYIKKVVEEGLARVGREEVKLIEYEDDRLGGLIGPIF